MSPHGFLHILDRSDDPQWQSFGLYFLSIGVRRQMPGAGVGDCPIGIKASAAARDKASLSPPDDAIIVCAFLYVGSRSIVSTLWKVDNKFTAALMKRFSTNLAAGRDVSDALRLAKLEMRRRPGPNATPYFWGPFTVEGDGLTRIQFARTNE